MLTECRAEQQTKIKTCLFYPYPRLYFSEWCHVPINIRQQDHAEKSSMCCVVQCIRRRNQARVKNTDLRHPSCTVVIRRRKSASPVLNVLSRMLNGTQSQFGEERNLMLLPGNKTCFLGCPSHSLVPMPTELLYLLIDYPSIKHQMFTNSWCTSM